MPYHAVGCRKTVGLYVVLNIIKRDKMNAGRRGGLTTKQPSISQFWHIWCTQSLLHTDVVEFSGESAAESLCPHQVQTTLGCKVLSTESLRQSMQGLVRKITVWLRLFVIRLKKKKKRGDFSSLRKITTTFKWFC